VRISQIVCILGALVVSACGTMLPGTIYSQDGKVMPMQIERAHRSGAMTELTHRPASASPAPMSAFWSARP
jgi:hypothetical protein